MANENQPPQVVYQVPGMADVVVQQGIVYQTSEGSALTLDIYRPSATASPLPAVLFVFGFPNSITIPRFGGKLKDHPQYPSWTRLLAASGITAITYETERPASDLPAVLFYLRQNAAELGIDSDRIGLWGCSGNGPTTLSALMVESAQSLCCAVLYYPFMLDWNGSHIVDEAAERNGFANPNQGKTIADLATDIPLFLVRAGQDSPVLNATIDHFVSAAVARNLPLTLVNYANGQHAFDVQDDSPAALHIIRQTISFLSEHLAL